MGKKNSNMNDVASRTDKAHLVFARNNVHMTDDVPAWELRRSARPPQSCRPFGPRWYSPPCAASI
eukprot:66731-Heterocapsa_arctica.AAC.1